jgi:hypothetical protein
VDSLNLGVTLFSYAETFFPPGALVFKGCALIMGGLSIGTQLVVAGCSRDGMTTDRLLAVLGTALSTGAAVAAGAAGKVLSVGDKVVDGVSTYRKSGAEGVFVDGAFMLAGFGLSKAGGYALRSVMTELDKSTKTQTLLRDMSRAVRQAGDSGSKLADSDGCRVTQSILKGSNIPAGGWLPGNKGMLVTDPSHLADHAVPHDVQVRAESDASVALPKAVSAVTHTEDHLKDAVRNQLDAWLGTDSSHSEGDHPVNIHGEKR